MPANIFWMKVKNAMENGMRKFSIWFQFSVKPELIEFLESNRETAMEIVVEVARDLAGASGAKKREAAVSRISDRLLKALPDLEFNSSWINLLVEIAVAALKAQGKI